MYNGIIIINKRFVYWALYIQIRLEPLKIVTDFLSPPVEKHVRLTACQLCFVLAMIDPLLRKENVLVFTDKLQSLRFPLCSILAFI